MFAFGLLDVFFAMLWFFLFVTWIIIMIRVISDIFRSHDLGGFAKVLWLLFIIAFPLIGALIYIIARGRSMTERDLKEAQRQEEAFSAYVRQTAGTSTSVADDLAKLTQLRDAGTISAEDYEAAKSKLLS
jgi:ABC-type multidrug transport system fused ATPase/permease subunit